MSHRISASIFLAFDKDFDINWIPGSKVRKIAFNAVAAFRQANFLVILEKTEDPTQWIGKLFDLKRMNTGPILTDTFFVYETEEDLDGVFWTGRYLDLRELDMDDLRYRFRCSWEELLRENGLPIQLFPAL